MAESHLVLDTTISGKPGSIELKFVVTSIGSHHDPDYDCYLFSVQMQDMNEPDLPEYLELKAKDNKKVGDVVWSIRDVTGDKEDPSDPDEERRITTYKIPEVVFKTFEDEGRDAMARATISYPFEAVLSTKNWTD